MFGPDAFVFRNREEERQVNRDPEYKKRYMQRLRKAMFRRLDRPSCVSQDMSRIEHDRGVSLK